MSTKITIFRLGQLESLPRVTSARPTEAQTVLDGEDENRKVGIIQQMYNLKFVYVYNKSRYYTTNRKVGLIFFIYEGIFLNW